jgi:hypothetical protein
LIARVIAELASQSSGSDEELEGACGRVMHTTPCRFMRCNNCRSWNTGNGSPDAACFTVDRPGVAIFGIFHPTVKIVGTKMHFKFQVLEFTAAEASMNTNWNF